MPVRAAVPEEFLPFLGPVPGLDIISYDPQNRGHVPGGGQDVDILSLPMIAGPWLKRMDQISGLRAVILASAGFEHALPYLPDGVTMANAVGVHDTATAELAMTLLLAAQRGLAGYVLTQQEYRWQRPGGPFRSLADSRILILGYGGIGRALAAWLIVSECHVTAIASHPREGDEIVGHVHGVDELHTLAVSADILIVSAPLTVDTQGMVDVRLLDQLPDDALVCNIARGAVVDTEALQAACATGRIRAAHGLLPAPPADCIPGFRRAAACGRSSRRARSQQKKRPVTTEDAPDR